jgi:hypothetical protein
MAGKLHQKPVSRPEISTDWALGVEILEPHEDRGDKLYLIGVRDNSPTSLGRQKIAANGPISVYPRGVILKGIDKFLCPEIHGRSR